MTRYIRHLAAIVVVLSASPAPAGRRQETEHPASSQALELDSDRRLHAAKRLKRKKRQKERTPSPQESAPENPSTDGLSPPPPLQSIEGRKTVAVLPIQAIEIPEELRTSIEAAILTEIDEAGGLAALSPDDVRARADVLGDHGFTRPFTAESCGGNIQCLATAGRYARAHYALDTRVSGVGGTVKIAMRLFDTQEQRERTRVAEVVSETDEKERARQLHRMSVQLLQPDTYVGSLRLECDEAGAEVYLNDELVGSTPLDERIQNLPAGPYIMRVSKEGFSDVYQFVDVAYRNVTTYKVSLNQNTIASTLVEQESERGFGNLYVYATSGEFELRIDGDPRGRVPLGGIPVTEVAAGERRVSLRYPGGEPLIQPVTIEQGRRTDITIEEGPEGYQISAVKVVDAGAPFPEERLAAVTAELAPQAVAPASHSLGWRLTTGLVLGGLGVVGLGAGAYFSNQVTSLDAEAREIERLGPYPDGAPELARAAELNDEGAAAETNQQLAYIVGGALIAVGAGFVIWDFVLLGGEPEAPTPETRTSVTVTANPLPGGGFLGFTLDW